MAIRIQNRSLGRFLVVAVYIVVGAVVGGVIARTTTFFDVDIIPFLLGIPIGVVGALHAKRLFPYEPVQDLATRAQKRERRIVVEFLREHPASTREEIAKDTGLPLGSIAESLAYMHLDGYVDGVMDHDSWDQRREVRYTATDKEL